MFRKKFCTIAILVLLCTSVFVVSACDQKIPDPPVMMGTATSFNNGVTVSVESFSEKQLFFVDRDKHAQQPKADTKGIAVLRIKIKNTTAKEVTYTPLHHVDSNNLTLQLSNLPDPLMKQKDFDQQGGRTHIPQYALQENVFTTGQVMSDFTLSPGAEIVDEYLFKKPVNNNENLLLLVPGVIVGDPSQTLRFEVKPYTVEERVNAAGIGTPYSIDKVSFTVTSIDDVYAELEQLKPEKELKYPYAYTTDVLLRIGVEIQNNSNNRVFYSPGHLSPTGVGVSLEADGGNALNRVKLPDGVFAKGQPKTQDVAIEPGSSFKDYFFFSRPVFQNGDLKLYISGHLVNLKGLYRFKLPYSQVDPKMPNFEPWKAPTEEELAAMEAAAANAEAPAEGEPTAEGELPAAE